jgi:hypothetical protein
MVNIGVDHHEGRGIVKEVGTVFYPAAGTEDLRLHPHHHFGTPFLLLYELLYLFGQVMGVDDDPRCPYPQQLINGDSQ